MLGRGPGVETVDQGRPQAPSGVFGRDADLLDMGATIDLFAEEVRHRPIVCVDGDPRVSGRDERLELGELRRLVSRDLGHADHGEGTPSPAFDVA